MSRIYNIEKDIDLEVEHEAIHRLNILKGSYENKLYALDEVVSSNWRGNLEDVPDDWE